MKSDSHKAEAEQSERPPRRRHLRRSGGSSKCSVPRMLAPPRPDSFRRSRFMRALPTPPPRKSIPANISAREIVSTEFPPNLRRGFTFTKRQFFSCNRVRPLVQEALEHRPRRLPRCGQNFAAKSASLFSQSAPEQQFAARAHRCQGGLHKTAAKLSAD